MHPCNTSLDTDTAAAPCALHPAPCTLHPAPYTLHPAPWASSSLSSSAGRRGSKSWLGAPARGVRIHSTQHTLHTSHFTLHTTHYTLHTTHYTPHTTHYTLHPAPCDGGAQPLARRARSRGQARQCTLAIHLWTKSLHRAAYERKHGLSTEQFPVSAYEGPEATLAAAHIIQGCLNYQKTHPPSRTLP